MFCYVMFYSFEVTECFIMSGNCFCRKLNQPATASKRSKTSHAKEYDFEFIDFYLYFDLACFCAVCFVSASDT